MRRGVLTLLAAVMVLLASTAIGEEPSLDLRLAVEIYDAQQSQVDRLVEAGDAKDRVLAIRSCFEALRQGDLITAREQLSIATESGVKQEPAALGPLAELEVVAAAAIALASCDTNQAAKLLDRLPERDLRGIVSALPPIHLEVDNIDPLTEEDAAGETFKENVQPIPPWPSAPAATAVKPYNAAAVSAWNYLRARLLASAGRLPDAYALARNVANERADRLGFFHAGTLTVHSDAIEYGLLVVGAEKLYGTSADAWRHPRLDLAPPELQDRMIASHSRVLLGTDRTREAIDLIENRIVERPDMAPEVVVEMLATVSLCYRSEKGPEKALGYAEDAWRIAKGVEPADPWLRCRVLFALASAQTSSGYSSKELTPCFEDLYSTTKPTAAEQLGKVSCLCAAASVLLRDGRQNEANEAIVDAMKTCFENGWHGLEQEIGLNAAMQAFSQDRFELAIWFYDRYLPTGFDNVSPQVKKHTLLYATCRKRTGEWKKCLALLSPIQDDRIDLENTVDIGIAVLHAEAVGRCGDWPESVRLSRSIVQQLSSREDPDADGGQWASQLLFAYQGLVNELTENGELDEANRALAKSEKLAAKAHGQSSPWRLGIVKKQGEIAMRQQRYVDAAELFGQIESETADNENATEFHEHARSRRNEALRLANASEADTAAPALAR